MTDQEWITSEQCIKNEGRLMRWFGRAEGLICGVLGTGILLVLYALTNYG